MEPTDQQPSTSSPARTPSLAVLVAGIIGVCIAVAVITGLIAREFSRESAKLAATVGTLQKDLESLRGDMKALRADSERTAVLSLTDPGYFPLRTNGGILLVAVEHTQPAENGLRVDLRIGNPQSMTYRGFTLAFAWDKGKTTQVFPHVLPPETWTAVSVSLAPADPASTKSLTITSATVDEIVVR